MADAETVLKSRWMCEYVDVVLAAAASRGIDVADLQDAMKEPAWDMWPGLWADVCGDVVDDAISRLHAAGWTVAECRSSYKWPRGPMRIGTRQ